MKKFIALLIISMLATSFILGGCSEKPIEYTVEGDYKESTYDEVQKLVEEKSVDLSTNNFDMYQDVTTEMMAGGEYLKTMLTLTGVMDVNNVEFVGRLKTDYTAKGYNIENIMKQDPTAIRDTEYVLKDNKAYMTYLGLKVYVDLYDSSNINYSDALKYIEELADSISVEGLSKDMLFAVCEEGNQLKVRMTTSSTQTSSNVTQTTSLQIFMIFDGDALACCVYNVKTELTDKSDYIKNHVNFRITVTDEQLEFPNLAQYEEYKGQ